MLAEGVCRHKEKKAKGLRGRAFVIFQGWLSLSKQDTNTVGQEQIGLSVILVIDGKPINICVSKIVGVRLD